MTARLNLVGRTFDQWTVLAFGGYEPKRKRSTWLCKCSCGTEAVVAGGSLMQGLSTACRTHPRVDLVGKRFGQLTVVKYAGRCDSGASFWRCQCDCGKQTEARGNSLTYGTTKSCGCGQGYNRRHGESSHQRNGKKGTTEYQSWSAMLSRCTNPNDDNWENYGGRGITVCERWRSYINFLADMGRKPSPRHSLDRINVNGNYEPTNCRWATKKEQANNRRPIKFGKLENFSNAMLIAEAQRRGLTIE